MNMFLTRLARFAACLTLAVVFAMTATAKADCLYSISPTNKVHGKGSSSGTITVSLVSGTGCDWEAFSSNSWLKITSVSSSPSGGSVSYDISSNPGTTLRRGSLNIAGQTYYVLQWGSSCEFILNPTSKEKCFSSATGSVNVTTHSSCNWEVVNTNDWVLITSPLDMEGGGKVYYTVLSNYSTATRTGVVMIGGQPFTLVQSGIPYSCSPDKTVPCGQAWNFDPPSDRTPSQNNVVQVLSTATNVTGNTTVATRTWSVTDHCGNAFTCSQSVTVLGSAPPTLTCSPQKRIEAGQAWDFDPPISSNPNLDVAIVGTVTNSSDVCLYTFDAVRTWRVTDQCGVSATCSQTVTVMDSTPPQFTGCADKTVSFGSPWTFDLPVVSDAAAGTNINLVLVGTVTNTAGFCGRSYSVARTWRATDPCQNAATCTQTINVMDTTAPTLRCGKGKTVECGTAWSFDSPTTTNTGVTITLVSTVTNQSDICANTFEVMRTWKATDSCGNSSTCSQTVTVMDTLPPELICAADKTVQYGSTWTFDPPSVYDLCDGTNVSLQVVGTSTNTSGFCGRSYMVTRTWRATDDCDNSVICMQNVLVSETVLPGLAALPNQTVAEGSQLRFTASVTNFIEPGRNFLFSLEANAPEGASIDPVTGAFAWTPAEAQGPGVYPVSIRVTDSCVPSLSSVHTLTVTVTEQNTAPVLAAIGSQGVVEGNFLTFKATATDADLPEQTLLYSLAPGAPVGAQINPTTGVFTWTPTEIQGPATNLVTVRVTDNGTPPGTTSETIVIVVLEANSAPLLAPIPNQNVTLGSPLTFRASATDADLPAQTLSFALDASAPEGAAIDPVTGVFTWTPSVSQGAGSYPITITVCDDGTPSLCAHQTFNVVVGGTGNLRLSIVGGPEAAVLNCNYTYRLTISNQGPATAVGVMLTNYLPHKATFVYSLPGGSLSPTCPGWTFYLGDLPPGGSTNATIVIVPGEVGSMTNVASVGAMDPEVDTTDNWASHVITVDRGLHLQITSPAHGAILPAGANIEIMTAASDVTASIKKVEFFVGDLKLGECLNAPYTLVWTNPPPGDYLLTARGVDALGNQLCAASVAVSVVPGLSIGDAFVSESNGKSTEVVFPVRLSQSSTQAVSVSFYTSDGTAWAGFDYVPLQDTITFLPGVTNRTISIPVFGDTLSEFNEAFYVTLTQPVNAAILKGEGVGTIRDNNDPMPRLHICDVVVGEGNQGTSEAVFVVQLSTTSGRTVAVNYNTTPGTASNNFDFTPVSGVLTFPPGTLHQSIRIPVVGDLLNENNERFFVNLSKPANATVAHAQGLATIVDDDPMPTVAIGNATVTEGNSGTVPANFEVSLSAPSGKPVSVRYATANGTAVGGTDFVPTGGTLTFPPGALRKTISVSVRGDAMSESNEMFFVNLSGANNCAISQPRGTGSILDDDALPALSISDVTVSESGTATFRVRLSAPSGRLVSVQYATADATAQFGLDYQTANGFLVFPPGTVSKNISVSIIPDKMSEDKETFVVYMLNAVNASIAQGQAKATILDNDPMPVVSVNDVSVKEGHTGNAFADFNVRLSAPSARPVSVTYSVTAGTASEDADYLPATGTLVFLSGITNLVIPVTILGDYLSENDETFFLNLSAPVSAKIGRARATGTILNDDEDVSISINNVTLPEPDQGRTNAEFSVSLSAASGKKVQVRYNTLNGSALAGSDFQSVSGTLSFNPGVTNLTLPVPVMGDTLSESNETFLVRLFGAVNGKISTPQGSGTILDNNDPLPTLSINDVSTKEGGIANFTLRLSARSGRTISVDYSTFDGTALANSDYLTTNGTVTFAPGVMSRTISVPILHDTISESNEVFFVNLGNPVNTTLARLQGQGTILDNDPAPAISINDIAAYENSSAFFTVRLSARSGKPVTVSYSTANGTALAGVHYTPASGLLTIPPGVTNMPLSILLLDDGMEGTSNRFTVNLTGAANATLAHKQGTCTVVENRSTTAKSTHAKTETDLKITSVKVVGTNVLISFPTLAGRTHLLEYNEQSVSEFKAWKPVAGAANLLGTGGNITATHLGGGSRTNCFYRIRVLP